MVSRLNTAVNPKAEVTALATDKSAKSNSELLSVKGHDKRSATLWFLYMVRCANGQLYTGITTDVTRRFSEHQSGSAKSAKFLRGKGPLSLVYSETVGSHSDALKREIALKKWPRAKKLALISEFE
ncbi:GIY-YIG nuclease family protein [Shewanella pneumatophori]|uniref:GIY-YIG nuclease family protein n=1 Tax=Shewanella pneumatophori TaxID=314092 RepID=A0A9X1ZR37_9GAMM|nr:GIY-YIG nuclease family protein [Shewanella pneumatophori]MCL1140526.1 GIY-YIG nuclease family protein [Shewanella pneumatophori]